MSGHVDVICYLLEKERENTVIRFTKLCGSCGRCKQEPWCDQYVCWCCSSHYFSFSSRKENLFSIPVSIYHVTITRLFKIMWFSGFHNPGCWQWSTTYRAPDTFCFRLEELSTFCQFKKLSWWRVITIQLQVLVFTRLCLLVVYKVIFQSGVMWILFGNSSPIQVVCDSISGSWHQVFSEAGCSKSSVRLIQQWQLENWLPKN